MPGLQFVIYRPWLFVGTKLCDKLDSAWRGVRHSGNDLYCVSLKYRDFL